MSRARWWWLFALAMVASVALLLVFSAPTVSSPLFAPPGLMFAAQDWMSPSARLAYSDDSVRVTADTAPGTALIVRDDLQVAASQYRYLRYRASDVDADARLLLLWRADGELQRVPLAHVLGRGTLDLAALPGWEGEVHMLGIAALPIDYIAADAVAEQSFVLHSAELRPDNWVSAVSALLTDWLASRPWTGASINTAGNEFGRATASLTGFVACWIALLLLCARAVLGSAAMRRVLPALLLAGASLLALDLAHDLFGRARSARAAAADVRDAPQWPLAADPGLAGDAERLRTTLENQPPQRVLVFSEQPFRRDYTTYLLRAFDAGQLFNLRGFGSRPAFDDAVLVFAGPEGWEFDPATSRLVLAGQSREAQIVWQGEQLVAFRLGRAGASP